MNAAPPLSRAASIALVALSTSLMVVSYIDRQVFAILAPTITRELHITDDVYGLLGGMFSVGYLVGPPFVAAMLDVVGVRRGLPLAVVLWSLVAAAHAGVVGIAMLFVLRFALGLAEAPSFPGGARVVKEVVSPANAPRAIGFLFTGSSIGAFIAPPIAVALYSAFGWRYAFVGTALVGLSWLPLWWLASSRPAAKAVLDSARADATVGSPSVLAALREPPMLRAICAVMAAAPVAAFTLLWGSKLLVTRFGVSQTGVARYLWLPPLLYDAGAIGFGELASRARRSSPRLLRPLFALAALLTATLGGIAFVSEPMQATVIAGVALLGVGGVFVILTSEVLERVPRSLVSVAAGLSAAAQSLAYVVSSAAVGRVVAGHGGYDVAVLGLAVWVVPGSLAWLFWPARASEGKPAVA